MNGVGAVVVGGDYQGLGIVRSLGRRGIPVCIVDDERSIGRFSRYATASVRVGDLRDERRCVDTLLAVAARHRLDGWVVYPTREETVAACSRYRDELSRCFRVPTPGWETIRFAWDKRNTHERAQELGIPTARTWWPADEAELGRIEADPPLVIKPAIKEHFLYATRAKAWRVDTREELRRRFAEATAIAGPREAMVQELLPGDGYDRLAYCAFFKDGHAVASLVARRLRQHPPQFGRASTLVESVDVPQLEEPSHRFLSSIGYYGLVELEYMHDPRDGEFKLLDVNARTWGYHSIGGPAGVDFPWLLFADQVGVQAAGGRGRAGVRWLRVITDLPTAIHEVVRGRLGVREYLRSLRHLDVEAVLSADDPLPFLAELALVPYLVARRGF